MKSDFGSAKISATWVVGAIAIGALLISACLHSRTESMVGTHKIKVTRTGFTNRAGVENSGRGETFRYDGFGHMGRRLQVSIQDDLVSIDGQTKGLLKRGDSVLISDAGIAVNALDYGESASYMETDAREAQSLRAVQKPGT